MRGKHYKDFDKKFKEYIGSAWKQFTSLELVNIDTVIGWPYTAEYQDHYDPKYIADTCYNCSTAEDWQRFRVSLKGCTTKIKLASLQRRWDTHYKIFRGARPTSYVSEWGREMCRINNYLSALRRGGFLDQQLRVIK